MMRLETTREADGPGLTEVDVFEAADDAAGFTGLPRLGQGQIRRGSSTRPQIRVLCPANQRASEERFVDTHPVPP